MGDSFVFHISTKLEYENAYLPCETDTDYPMLVYGESFDCSVEIMDAITQSMPPYHNALPAQAAFGLLYKPKMCSREKGDSHQMILDLIRGVNTKIDLEDCQLFQLEPQGKSSLSYRAKQFPLTLCSYKARKKPLKETLEDAIKYGVDQKKIEALAKVQQLEDQIQQAEELISEGIGDEEKLYALTEQLATLIESPNIHPYLPASYLDSTFQIEASFQTAKGWIYKRFATETGELLTRIALTGKKAKEAFIREGPEYDFLKSLGLTFLDDPEKYGYLIKALGLNEIGDLAEADLP